MSLKSDEPNSKINSCEREDIKTETREGTLGYNIKKITAKMNNYQIEELVLTELGIEVDPIWTWNKLITQFENLKVKNCEESSFVQNEKIDVGENQEVGASYTPTPFELLSNRVKGQKLTHNQRIKIYQLIKVEEMPSSVVSSKYCLSISTINRIVSYFDAHPHELKYEDEENGSKIFISKKVVEVVQEFINCQDTPIWSKDIWKYVQENLKISIAPNTITKYLKSNMKMSFKRVSSRQIKADFQRIRKLKMLFAVIWWQKLWEIRCIVNIDESTFSRATRNNYTWWRRGSPGITKNDVLTGSLNLISAILTTGSSYSAIVKGTTVSQTFIDYMEELIHYIETIDKIQMENVLWILDNAPWHQSKKVLKYLDSKGVRYLFLPPYCPELAPVELFFSQLKKSLSRAVKVPVKMNTGEGTNLVKHHIQMITPNRIKRLFSNFTKVLYSILEDTKII